MAGLKLSNRDKYILIKEAGAIDDFISGMSHTVQDRLQLKTKPFQTLLSLAAPFVLGKTLLGKVLLTLGENYGLGFGTWIGSWLDNKLGFGDPENMPNLSEGDLQSASEGATNELLGKTVGIKAWALNEPPQIIRKAAIGGSRRNNVLDILGKSSRGWALSPTSIIKSLVMTVVKALAMAGIIGGAAKMILGPSGQEENEERAKQLQNSYAKSQHYVNIKENVEQTLIAYLDTAFPEIPNNDNKMRNFSETFQYLNEYPLIGSSEMKKILQQVTFEHSLPIETINSLKNFYGPKIINVAQQLIPKLQFGAGGPKEELKKLLQGVLT